MIGFPSVLDIRALESIRDTLMSHPVYHVGSSGSLGSGPLGGVQPQQGPSSEDNDDDSISISGCAGSVPGPECGMLRGIGLRSPMSSYDGGDS